MSIPHERFIRAAERRTQATPRPWKLEPSTGRYKIVAYSDPSSARPACVEVARIIRRMDAAFIVRACNNFDSLVEALEGLLHRFEAEGYDPPWANVRDARLALQKAREA